MDPYLTLDDAVRRWQTLKGQGRAASLDDLCAGSTETSGDLSERLRAVASMAAFLGVGPDREEGGGSPAAAPRPPVGPLDLPGYEVLGEIGRGGMGVVYLARQTGLDRVVALKRILTPCQATPQQVARFRNEARAVAQIRHPNIVQVHEVGEHGGLPHITFEYVRGGSLDRRLAGRPLPAGEAARFVELLARAVHAAHERGVVHRDLKPGNVLLEDEGAGVAGLGAPKVTDFGLAKLADADSNLTATNSVMGSPSYMAPEQAEGRVREVGPPADIYALGAILYEVLTGRPPFRGAGVLDTLRQVKHDEPVRPSRLVPGLDRDIETVALKCLEKEPGRRYATAAALADDLDRYRRDEPIAARPVGGVERVWRWCRRNPVVARLVLAVAATVAVAVLGLSLAVARVTAAGARARLSAAESRDRLVRLYVNNGLRTAEQGDYTGALPWLVEALGCVETEPAASAVHRLRLARVLELCPSRGPSLSHERVVRHAEFSPDGLRVVTASDDGTARLWDARTGGPVGAAMSHDLFVWHAAFSPDGASVATASSDGTARVWDARTGTPLTPPLAHGRQVKFAAFSPDGRRLATAAADGTVRVFDAATGRPALRPWRSDAAARNETVDVVLAFSPDGRRLLRVAKQDRDFSAGKDEGTARVWDLVADRAGASPPHPGMVNAAAFSPDGLRLATAGQDGSVRFWDVETGANAGEPLPHAAPVVDVAFSPDGRRLATAAADGTVRVWGVGSGTNVSAVPSLGGVPSMVRFDPAGTAVVAVATTEDSRGIVRVWDATTGEARTPPIRDPDAAQKARFSPDGRRLLTSGGGFLWDAGRAQVWELSTAGGPTRVFPLAGSALALAVGPDGRLAASTGDLLVSEARGKVVGLDPGKDTPSALKAELNRPSSVLAFAPDGRGILTVENALLRAGRSDGRARLWDTETGAARPGDLTHPRGIAHAAFSPDGGRVVTAGRDARARVWDARTLSPVGRPLVHSAPLTFAGFSPDGGRVVTASADQTARVWDAATGEPVCPALRHPYVVRHAAFSPDGRRVATAALDGAGRVWDVGSGRLLAVLPHAGWATRVGFSPDGRVLLVCGGLGARLWDWEAGAAVSPPLKHGGWVNAAAFSPNGRMVLTAGNDHTARLWDAATGAAVGPPLRHRAAVVAAAFASDGGAVFTASGAEVLVWRMTPETRPLDTLKGLARDLSGRQVDASGTLEVVPTAARRVVGRGKAVQADREERP